MIDDISFTLKVNKVRELVTSEPHSSFLQYSESPLFEVVKRGNVGLAARLIDMGAPVNVRNKVANLFFKIMLKGSCLNLEQRHFALFVDRERGL